ncbi:MAG: hypothetical protein HY962_06520 [Ignavibacteriae bacterium]|nr:hypothetical protein [Ignavibacteriota bacterium]
MKGKVICYLVRNKLNDTIFIGFTTLSLENRIRYWTSVGNDLKVAIETDGLENFEWTVLKDDFQTHKHAEIFRMLAKWFYGPFLAIRCTSTSV